MIDFHTHILPEMDDGSGSTAESLALLRLEREQGVEQVVLTPHFYAGQNSPSEFLTRRQKSWQRLQSELTEGLPRLALGAEVQYFEGICSTEDLAKLRIEGTDLLLLEMPFSPWPERVAADVLTLQQRQGFQVVLAHIERYLTWQPETLWQQLREQGVWMQANVSFFSRWQTRRRALRMLERGEIQLLGSDCHNLKERAPNWVQLPERARRLAQQIRTPSLML